MRLAPVVFAGSLLLSCLEAQPAFNGVERIVAVGDVHGDLNQFLTVLRAAKVIDQKNKWIGGKTHLVQVGDIPDRGPDTRKIYDLLMSLEKPARKAGGMVHALMGNHDAMNVYGDLRYVTAEEFAAFRTGQSADVRNAQFEAELPEIRKAIEAKGGKPDDVSIRRQFDEAHPLGWYEHRFAYGPEGKYGKWIRSRPVMVVVNRLLFVHAGISPKYAAKTVAEINSMVAEEFKDFSRLQTGAAIDEEGPLWYRGLARGPEAQLAAHVDQLTQFHQVDAIVIGHTPTAGAILPRFGGKVVMIDVGLSKYYGGPPAALVVEGGKRFALHRGQILPLPSAAEDLLAYLKSAAALDPTPSPLLKLISGSAVEATRNDP